eukprot:Hpha_TRINITY_DN19391_c0_g1::TRINITY_DN19391_c0_g1_i1::g.81135::m.81135
MDWRDYHRSLLGGWGAQTMRAPNRAAAGTYRPRRPSAPSAAAGGRTPPVGGRAPPVGGGGAAPSFANTWGQEDMRAAAAAAGRRSQLAAVREGQRRASRLGHRLAASLNDLGGQERRLGEASARLRALREQLDEAARCLTTEGESKVEEEPAGVDPPEELLCPIAYTAMKSPVRTRDGHAYDRRAIEAWFQACRREGRGLVSPLTNLPLPSSELTPCPRLRAVRARWLSGASQSAVRVPSPPAASGAACGPPVRIRMRGLPEALHALRGSRETVAELSARLAHGAPHPHA